VSADAAFYALTAGVAPALLAPPVNVARVLMHPDGLAPRIVNFDEWAWRVLDRVGEEATHNADPELAALLAELEPFAPERPRESSLGFAVPLHLRSQEGDMHLLTTLTRFGTAVDVTVAELRLEAFLPADVTTAAILSREGSRRTSRRAS
jgi:MmyB-like transcription regulator ligand binding domain